MIDFVGYDVSVDAGIANSFATAAMRFGHTQLQGTIRGRDALYRPLDDIQLSTVSDSIDDLTAALNLNASLRLSSSKGNDHKGKFAPRCLLKIAN